jgi:hypothetical protein
MAKPRLSIRKVKEVLRLGYQCGLSRRQVAQTLKVSRSAVADYLSRAAYAGIGWPLPDAFTDQELEQRLFPRKAAGLLQSKPLPDFVNVEHDLRAKQQVNLTLDRLWRQYKEEHPDGYQYSQFTTLFREWQQAHGLRPAPRSKWRIAYVCEEDVTELMKWRRSNNRIQWAKAVVVLDSNQGTTVATLCSKLGQPDR